MTATRTLLTDGRTVLLREVAEHYARRLGERDRVRCHHTEAEHPNTPTS